MPFNNADRSKGGYRFTFTLYIDTTIQLPTLTPISVYMPYNYHYTNRLSYLITEIGLSIEIVPFSLYI